MTNARLPVVSLAFLAATAAAEPGDTGNDEGVRAIAEAMSQQPLVEVENSLRAWAV
jgi:hypothetical protein